MGKKPKKSSPVQRAKTAKRPSAPPKAAKPAKKKTPSARQPTIKPPRAPALMQSPEVGAHVAQDQAISERLRLYPKATTQEIVAMFELDGVKISPAMVEQARRRGRSRAAGK